jgi:hypothetical protein
LALSGCDEPAPPLPVPSPLGPPGATAPAPASLPQADARPQLGDAGAPPDFRAQRVRDLNRPRSDEYDPWSIEELYRNNPVHGFCGTGNKWLGFAGRPHTPTTIASLRAVFEKSTEPNLRRAVLWALSVDRAEGLTDFWQSLERRADFTEEWIPPIIYGQVPANHAEVVPWLADHVGRSPAWDRHLASSASLSNDTQHHELPPKLLEQILRDPHDDGPTRADALCTLLRKDAAPVELGHRDEALASKVPELVAAALRCAHTPPSKAVLEAHLVDPGPTHTEVARLLLDGARAPELRQVDSALALQLAVDADPQVRRAAGLWWNEVLQPGASPEADPGGNSRGASAALERAVGSPASPASRQPNLLYLAGRLAELRGEPEGAMALYRRALVLGPTVLEAAERELIENLRGALHLRLALLLRAQGKPDLAEPYLREMETTDIAWVVSSGRPFNHYDSFPKELAARLRKEAARPLKLAAAPSRDRQTLLIHLTNTGMTPLEIGLATPDSYEQPEVNEPVPAFTWAFAAGEEVARFSGKSGSARQVTIGPGKTYEIRVPAKLSKLPRRYLLDVVVDLVLPKELAPETPGRPERLEFMSAGP